MSIILLFNGPSSSGKSTFIKSLRPFLDQSFLFLSSDQLVGAGVLPEVDRQSTGRVNSWNVVRPKFFDGFHRSIKAFADAGNHLIVEHVVETKQWFDDLMGLLKDHRLIYIGVFCPVEILEAREVARGDRFIGEGRSHLEDGIHTWGPYDLEINTHMDSVDYNVNKILASLRPPG